MVTVENYEGNTAELSIPRRKMAETLYGIQYERRRCLQKQPMFNRHSVSIMLILDIQWAILA